MGINVSRQKLKLAKELSLKNFLKASNFPQNLCLTVAYLNGMYISRVMSWIILAEYRKKLNYRSDAPAVVTIITKELEYTAKLSRSLNTAKWGKKTAFPMKCRTCLNHLIGLSRHKQCTCYTNPNPYLTLSLESPKDSLTASRFG